MANTLDARIDHEKMLDRTHHRADAGSWSASSSRGMVATAHYLATAAGAETLAQGGNAFDAAIASSLALGVCDPMGSGLGGMAMMVFHQAEPARTVALASACRAPLDATPERVAAADRYRGYGAIAVPAYVALLDHVFLRYGSLPLPELMQPAIRFAREGVRITPLQRQLIGSYDQALRESSSAGWLFDDKGRPLRAGTVVHQPALCSTLERLATAGLQDFYHGEIARKIDVDMLRNGGFVRARDLSQVPHPDEVATLQAPYGSATAHTIGPPAGGLALAQMLHLLAALRHQGRDIDPDTADGAVRLAKLIRQARSDRRRLSRAIGATDLGAATELLEPEYNREVARAFDAPESGGETAHISVIDAAGNAVALTQSVERSFGCAEIGRDLGFFYNGYLRAFKVKNRRHPHFLQPGAIARSNAAPTVVVQDGQATLALGCTGSERMTSSLFQALLRLEKQPPFEAVHAPRLHCTPEGIVLCESDRMPREILSALGRSGFTLELLDPYAFKMGGMQLVVRRGGEFVGVGEPRRDGAASGP